MMRAGSSTTCWCGSNLVEETISWLSDPHLAMFSVIAVVVWQGTPFFTMGFLAGLQAIPKELYEAAEIDGASILQQFWYITIARLQPDLHHGGHAVDDLDLVGYPICLHLDERRASRPDANLSDAVV